MTVIWCFQLDKWKREAESVAGSISHNALLLVSTAGEYTTT